MSQLMPGDLFAGTLVRLTAPRPDDKEVMARWSHDADYLRHLDDDPARPRPADYYTEDKEDKSRDWRKFEFRIRTLAEDKLIGFIELFMQWNQQTAWLGIGIGEADYRGKGYGSDALRVVVSYAFRELGLYRVSLSVFSYNQRAIRAYEKVGFVHEGTLRSALYRDGQRFDMLLMGILRPEWEQQQAAQQVVRQALAHGD
jgi:RimJ/RimL family protein N-acetyltransferase